MRGVWEDERRIEAWKGKTAQCSHAGPVSLSRPMVCRPSLYRICLWCGFVTASGAGGRGKMEKPFWSIMPHLRPHCNISWGNSCISTNPHAGCFASGVSQSEINFPIHCLVFWQFQYIGCFLGILSHAILDCRQLVLHLFDHFQFNKGLYQLLFNHLLTEETIPAKKWEKLLLLYLSFFWSVRSASSTFPVFLHFSHFQPDLNCSK